MPTMTATMPLTKPACSAFSVYAGRYNGQVGCVIGIHTWLEEIRWIILIEIKEWDWQPVKKKDSIEKTVTCPYCNVRVRAISNTRIFDVATGAIKYHIHKCPECFMPIIIGLDGKIIPQSQFLPFDEVRYLPPTIEKLFATMSSDELKKWQPRSKNSFLWLPF